MEAFGLAAVLEDKAFQDGLRRYQDGIGQMESLTDRGSSVMSKVWAVGGGAVIAGSAAIAAGIGAIVAASKEGLGALQSWGEQIDTLSDRLGTSGEASSTFAVAMAHVGLSVDEGGAGINFFIKNLDNLKQATSTSTTTTVKSADAIAALRERLGDAQTRLERVSKTLAEAKHPTDAMRYAVEDAQKAVGRLTDDLNAAQGTITKTKDVALTPFAQAFQKLGVSAFDAKGKLLPVEELMPRVMDAFAKLPAGVNKTALAMDLFGARGGTRFIDFLSQGSAGLERARTMAELYGLTLSTDLSNAVEEFGFQTNDLKLAFQGISVIIGKAVLPVAVKFVDFLNRKIVPVLLNVAKRVAPIIAGALGDLGDMLESLFDLLSGRKEALDEIGDSLEHFLNLFGLNGKLISGWAVTVIDALRSVWNLIQMLLSGDFKGGIFGLSEDDPWILALLDAREMITKIWDALSKRDWRGVWNAISSGAEVVWGDLQPVLAELAGKIIEQVKGWSAAFWTWLTGPGGALEQTGALLGEMRDGIVQWLQKNGPGAWAQLQAWATEFWTWLTGRGGALEQVGVQLQQIASSIASYLDTVWTTTIGPALADWGLKLWNWLVDPKEGAIVKGSTYIAELAGKFREWAESGDTRIALIEGGKAIGKAVVDGVRAFFSDPKEGKSTMQQLIDNLGQAARDLYAGLKSIGQTVVGGILAGIVEDITGQKAIGDLANALYTWITDALSAALARGPFGLLHDAIVKALEAAFGGGGELPNAPGGQSPRFPVPQIPAGVLLPPGGVPQFQAVPLSLNVQIGGQQIQEANATWTAQTVTALVAEASARVAAGGLP